MTAIPLTRILASEEKQDQIRRAVQRASEISGLARLAQRDDAQIFTDLLSDPKISEPIYTLPPEITLNSIDHFIAEHLAERERGEGLLMIGVDEQGEVDAYHDVKIWPQWSACELGGAIRRNRQNSGQGGAGALTAFNWLFEELGVEGRVEEFDVGADGVASGVLAELLDVRHDRPVEDPDERRSDAERTADLFSGLLGKFDDAGVVGGVRHRFPLGGRDEDAAGVGCADEVVLDHFGHTGDLVVACFWVDVEVSRGAGASGEVRQEVGVDGVEESER